VVFNGTSSKNAVVDAGFAGTVAAVQINSGYGGTVSLNENLTVTANFTEAAGIFSAGASTLFVAGNFTVSGGTFNAGTGTVTFNQSGGTTNSTVTVSAPAVTFNNVTVAQGAPVASNVLNVLAISGSITVNGTFTYAGDTWTCISSGTINLTGDLDDQKFGWTGSPVFVFNGSGNQTLRDSHPLGTGIALEGQARNLTINKPSGTLFLATDLQVLGTFTLNAGTVNTGNYSWLLCGSIADNTGGNVGNVQLYGSQMIVTSPNLQVANLTFSGSAAALTGPTGTLCVSGNWNNSLGKTFNANGGTVVFDGTGATQQLTSGGKAFNNLTIAAGASVILEDDLGYLGVFTINGTFGPNGHKVNGQ
jgi:hypothetical protein